MINHPGILIAAPQSGSGKTLITISLLRAFSLLGLKIGAFKCGPDYIDPMFHRIVLGLPSKNLDLFFVDREKLREIYSNKNDFDLSIVEGVMGLYDGADINSTDASAYDIAATLGLPIILVINAKGMGRSVLSLIKGFKQDDRKELIKGVILNRTSKGFYERLKPLIEEETGLISLGYFPENKDLNISSRHLGLMQPEEIEGLNEVINKAADIAKESIDLDKIREIADNTGKVRDLKKDKDSLEEAYKEKEYKEKDYVEKTHKRKRIAVAWDEAFSFYYEENLDILRKYFDLTFFSPIRDDKLPENISGIIIGGGYPEEYAQVLSRNKSMKESILEKLENGIPVIAECGGFMYLSKTLSTKEGKCYDMVGYIDSNISYMGKLVRFGYCDIEDKTTGIKIRGHEFHYFDSDNNGDGCIMRKKTVNKSWHGVHRIDDQWIGYPHLYLPSSEEFINWFVSRVMDYSDKN